jgi:hypothetical protein
MSPSLSCKSGPDTAPLRLQSTTRRSGDEACGVIHRCRLFRTKHPAADWIDVQGVVVYKCQNAGLGVRFVSIFAEADLNFLNGWSKPRHTDRKIGNEESVAQGTRIAAALMLTKCPGADRCIALNVA